jgi:nitrite reductase (NADH) small subunit
MSANANWTKITLAANIPPREGRAVTVGDVEIAIFNLDGKYLTIDNECPHKGGPLCDGIVSGTAVVCPLHGRRFDLETGIAVRASEPMCVSTYATRIEGGIVLVDLSSARRALDQRIA